MSSPQPVCLYILPPPDCSTPGSDKIQELQKLENFC